MATQEITCPYCQSRVKRKGFSQTGTQRYQCLALYCHRTFQLTYVYNAYKAKQKIYKQRDEIIDRLFKTSILVHRPKKVDGVVQDFWGVDFNILEQELSSLKEFFVSTGHDLEEIDAIFEEVGDTIVRHLIFK